MSEARRPLCGRFPVALLANPETVHSDQIALPALWRGEETVSERRLNVPLPPNLYCGKAVQKHAARPKNSVNLGERLLEFLDVLEHLVRDDYVKLAVWERDSPLPANPANSIVLQGV